MKVALIGLGMVADMHVAAIKALGDKVQLSGVWGRTPARAQDFATRHGTVAYASLNDIASDASIDAAIVATPPDARKEIVQALAAAGKAILLEKPVERDLPRAIEIVEICEAAKVPLGVVLQHRMRPAARRLAELVAGGALGRIATVDLRVPWWRPQSYYDAPGRGTYDRDGGGVLITQAIHSIDLMLSLTGPVTRVSAMTASSDLHDLEAEDFVSAALSFASGATGALVASTTHFPGHGEEIVLNGTDGSAVLSAASLTVRFQDGREIVEGSAEATGGGADPMAFSHAWHSAVIEDFADALAKGRAPAITGRAALGAQALIDAIQSAARLARAVDVALPEGSTPPDLPGVLVARRRTDGS